MEEFAVRPAYGTPGIPLIEFRGDHRSVEFPSVHLILDKELPGLSVSGSQPSPDDFVWACTYDGGSFEISDDWGGLFIIPRSNPSVVSEQVAFALARSGRFKRVSWWGDENGA